MTTLTQTAAAAAAYSRRLCTLKGLDLVANNATVLPADVVTWYQDNLAKGSGPNGTYDLTDFFGSSIGMPYNDYLPTVTATINAQLTAGTLTTLNTIYSVMKNLITDVYGVPGAIVLPAPYTAGNPYASYDDALVVLITAADAAIGIAVTAMGAATTTLNTNWYSMTSHSANELVNQTSASIDFATIVPGSQLPITAFIPSLAGYGQETQVDMASQFLESIANTANQYGQAMVGALREGRNIAGINSINLEIDNGVPQSPSTVPPQATLSSCEYTPAEARALV